MVDCRTSIDDMINLLTKDYTKDHTGSFSFNSTTSERMLKIHSALRILYDDFVSGELTDNPGNIKYRPFETSKVPGNDNLLIIKFGKLEALIDCSSHPGKIIWRQVGRNEEILDLKHLLYRVSKLSIKSVATTLINNILIGLDILDKVKKEDEVFDRFNFDKLQAGGIGVVGLSFTNRNVGTKYQIDIQYETISLWENKSRCAIKTKSIDELIEQLYVEILIHE